MAAIRPGRDPRAVLAVAICFAFFPAHHLFERAEIWRDYFFLGEFPLDVSPAPRAHARERARVGEQLTDERTHLRRRLDRGSETVAADDGVRVQVGDHRYSPDPRLQVRVREPLVARGVDE